jgi:hypothetical protein
MPRNRNQFTRSKLISGTHVRVDPAKLKRKEVRAAHHEVLEARRRHTFRLDQAALGHATNIMETRRKLKEAERHYRDLTGEDFP